MKNQASRNKSGKKKRAVSLMAEPVSDRPASLARLAAEIREQNLAMMYKSGEVLAKISLLPTAGAKRAAKKIWVDTVKMSARNAADSQKDFPNLSDDQVNAAARTCAAGTEIINSTFTNFASIKQAIDDTAEVIVGIGLLIGIWSAPNISQSSDGSADSDPEGHEASGATRCDPLNDSGEPDGS